MEDQDNLCGGTDATLYSSHLGTSGFRELVLSSDVSVHRV